MKRLLASLLTVSALSINLAPFALADRPADMENTVQVQGRGVVKTSPDCFEISVNIRTEAKQMEIARKKNAEISMRLTSSVKALNIPGLKINTGSFNANPTYKYDNGKSQITGYEVNNSLNIIAESITDKDKLQDQASRVLTTSLNAGATSTNQIRFYLSDNNPVYDDALKSAVSQAKKRATILAEATGVKISGVYQIESYSQSSPEVYAGAQNMTLMRSMDAAKVEAEPTSVTATDVQVEASVNIRFDITD